MSRQYSLAIETVTTGGPARRSAGQAALTEFPFAQSRRAAETICRAIGIGPELNRIETGEASVIEVPLARVARMMPHYGDGFIATERDVTINGTCVDRFASRAIIAALEEARQAASGGSARKAFLRVH